MDFMQAINRNTKVLTENGAVAYKTSGNRLVDLNFLIPYLRVQAMGENSQEVFDRFWEAFEENHSYALRWLLYVRDVRGGLGERAIFRAILKHASIKHPEMFRKFLLYVPVAEYGRWDDLISLLSINEPLVESVVINLLLAQLQQDINNVKKNKSCSLLAKWLPSENASSRYTVLMATKIRKALGMSSRQYRVMLTRLRKEIKIVESYLSKKQYSEIDYAAVPSQANLKYKEAFLRHDYERRMEFLYSLTLGKTKVNANTQHPHEIVSSYIHRIIIGNSEEDELLESMWKQQKSIAIPSNILVIRDGSGSMFGCKIARGRTNALDVATALAIYCSENIADNAFKDKFITFSSEPKLVDISSCKTLKEKIQRCLQEDDCTNTNLEATFDLILSTAVKYNMSQKDIPSKIVCISDMQFDGCNTPFLSKKSVLTPTLMETISHSFEEHGYKMPHLVFWNCSPLNTGCFPLQENDLGITLMSGFSLELLNFIISGADDAWQTLKRVLDADRYNVVDYELQSMPMFN